MGHKCHIGRYGAVIHDGQTLFKFWSKTKFEALVRTFEGDMVQKRVKCVGADGASQNSTSAKQLTDFDGVVRSCGLNALVCFCGSFARPKS